MPPKCSICGCYYWTGHPCDCGKNAPPKEPAPVSLSAEMLGDDDRDYFAFIYDMAKAFHRNQSFLYAPEYGDDAIKWAEEFRDRLLNHGEG
jgi:hypothetical protein